MKILFSKQAVAKLEELHPDEKNLLLKRLEKVAHQRFPRIAAMLSDVVKVGEDVFSFRQDDLQIFFTLKTDPNSEKNLVVLDITRKFVPQLG